MSSRCGVRGLGVVALFVGALSVGGCMIEVASEGDGVAETEEPVYAFTGIRLFTENDWQVPVCFMTAGFQDAKDLIQSAVVDAYQNHKMNFTGWQMCATPLPANSVSIALADDPSHVQCSGTTLPGMGNYFAFGNQMLLRITPTRNAIRLVAVHEMGHALGLVHEHQRPDRTPETESDCLPQWAGVATAGNLDELPGNIYASEFDERSIMNYCRDWDRNDKIDLLGDPGAPPLGYRSLSVLDGKGFDLLYGHQYPEFERQGGFAFTASSTQTADATPQHSWNSWGNVPTKITHQSTGTYRVDFKKLGTHPGFNAQVSAFNTSRRCKIDSSTTSSTELRLTVKCRNPAGTLADAQFATSVVYRTDTTSAKGGYVYVDSATPATGNVAAPKAWNASGGSVGVQRTGLGTYKVTFPGQNSDDDRGNAQVTAVGTGSEYCKVGGMGDDGFAARFVFVSCFNTSGAAANSKFYLSYGASSHTATTSFGYTLASNPSSPTDYVGIASYTKSSKARDCGAFVDKARITRIGLGRYQVLFYGLPFSDDPNRLHNKTGATVTAYGGGSAYCNLRGWSSVLSTHTQVDVNCYSASGAAADAAFMVHLSSTMYDLCP